LDVQTSNASRQLQLLETQEARLSVELSKLSSTRESLETKLENMTQSEGPQPLSHCGTFFEQLRPLEAVLESTENEKSGLSAVVRSLKSDVNSFSGRNRRLLEQLTLLREQHSLLLTQTISRKNEIESKRIDLNLQTRSRDFLQQQCEETKARILETVTQLQEYSPEGISKLLSERAKLERTLDDEHKKLERLRHEFQTQPQRLNAQATQRKKEEDQAMSPVRWTGERSGLRAKVQKARQELAFLSSREKSATRTAEVVQTKIETLGYEIEDVKRAILCETGQFTMNAPQFMIDAMETEEQYGKSLKRQMEELDLLEKRIAGFRVGHDEITSMDESASGNAERISLLVEELKSLISSL
jgi:chromosome segregation ATPase